MIFNEHSPLVGKHAFLSASKNSWYNYSEEKLASAYVAALAARRGTELHALANNLIKLRVRLPDDGRTLSLYVNDAIGYFLTPEQVLFVSENCYGTADAIGYRDNVLRISDLKTGVTPSSPDQLKIYAAMFCLEYRVRPFETEFVLSIYQNDEVVIYETDPDEIIHVMDKIVAFDKIINEIRREAL